MKTRLMKYSYNVDNAIFEVKDPDDWGKLLSILSNAKDIGEAIEGSKDIADVFVYNSKTKYILVQSKFLLEQEEFEPQKVLGTYDSLDEALSHMFNVDYTQLGEIFSDTIDYPNRVREVVLNDCQYTLNIMEGR